MSSEEKAFVFPDIKEAPSRFRNALGKYRVSISKACNNCGLCLEALSLWCLQERNETSKSGF